MRLDEWIAGGERIDTPGGRVFVRAQGRGPVVTLLHGFPSSSWDWEKVAPLLAGQRRLVAIDFLGFGASDKPRRSYAIAEQADRVEAMWRHFGVTATAILAHDYGDTVTEELLARQAERPLAATIERAMLLNGAVIGHLNRILPIQKLLRVPGLGRLVARFSTRGLFTRNFRRVFSTISDDELEQHWQAISHGRGNRLFDKLVHHYGEHDVHAERWEGGLARTTVPVHFVWGIDDPVSGADMLAFLRTHCLRATFRELPGIRHYPQLEAPDVVAAELLAFDAAAAAS
jgi:pimeloyl-ACP methyl ester carboxylesterase